MRQPQGLTLDDAPWASDTENETPARKVPRVLDHSLIDLVIAPRLATLVNADQILFFVRVSIVQRGNHVHRSHEVTGAYRQLLTRQALADRSLQPG
jgi:ATP-binding cassette subfamily B protein AbcA/BmrA